MTENSPKPPSVGSRVRGAILRGFLNVWVRLFHRIDSEGRGHVPRTGGALLVSNHLSLVDALLLQAVCRRPIRFLMYKDYYERPWVRPLASWLRVIPISSRQRPREMIHALREASNAIQQGELVGIFAEGQITRIGQLLPFRRGFERIMKDVEAPIVPVCLDGVWGSVFSFEQGRFVWKMPRRIPQPVVVKFGKPLPHTASPQDVRRAVQELSFLAWRKRKATMRPLPRALIATARHHPFRPALSDARVPKLTLGGLLTKSVYVARRLRAHWQDQPMVGILLPPSVGGALVNYAALLMGKVPVNLNYTASTEILDACVRQCGIRNVVSSKAFLERLKLKVPAPTLLLEEVLARPRLLEKLAALALGWLLPARGLEKALGCAKPVQMDDLATIIFSSGSTGDPKGVMLTHYNLVSNIEQIEQIFALGPRDRLLGILPFFHSFGFMGTVCLPVVLGAQVVFHPTPLEAEAIGDLVRKHVLTFLLATPTFLQLYLRSCEPEDFGSLQYVIAGAEKLPERLATAFEEKFGLRPFEGYGCTECSPVVAVNTRDFRAAGIRQVGAKRGKIGHPLPGMTIRIADPATLTPRGPSEPGLLLVKGPNVMKGYLNRPDKTAEAFHEGWYITGDIATEDEDGFLQITDRLSRFSKIGGEMVPHIRVEEALHQAAHATEQTFVVCGVPDPKKGERLVVLHTLAEEPLKATQARLSQLDLPNLWIPRPDQFYRVPAFPLLGTGKLDLRRVKEMAVAEAEGTSGAEPAPCA